MLNLEAEYNFFSEIVGWGNMVDLVTVSSYSEPFHECIAVDMGFLKYANQINKKQYFFSSDVELFVAVVIDNLNLPD